MRAITGMAMLTYAACTAASAGIGAALLPNMADKALRAKHAQIHAAIERQLESWNKLKADPESFDDASAARIERWARQMSRMEEIGKVEHSVAVKLADAGIVAEARTAEEYVSIPEEMWRLDVDAKSRAVCGLSLAALAAIMLSPWLITPAPSIACAPICVALLFVVVLAVACDIRAKVIPYQLCALAAVPSIALMLTANPSEAWPVCIACGIAAPGAFWLLSKLSEPFGIKGAVGTGDLRLMPWVCLPLGANGTAYGAVLCILFLFAWAICIIVKRKAASGNGEEGGLGYATATAANPSGSRKKTYVAMGPGLALWLAAGFACAYLAPPLLHLG